jgi:hypothetical protein
MESWGIALGFCVFWSWCYVFAAQKKNFFAARGVREELFSKGSLKKTKGEVSSIFLCQLCSSSLVADDV